MKTRAAVLNLRKAKASDFADALGNKKYGCMYFQQSIDGTFCNQPYFFHEHTNLEVFRELYGSGQIWVLANFFDRVEIVLRDFKRQKKIIQVPRRKRSFSHKNRFIKKSNK